MQPPINFFHLSQASSIDPSNGHVLELLNMALESNMLLKSPSSEGTHVMKERYASVRMKHPGAPSGRLPTSTNVVDADEMSVG
jgi:hypothetical protein